jgi:hypothetical protein
MKYIPAANSSAGGGKVIYEGKTTGRFETFSALDFLARLVTHIPNKYEQTVRYYGYYSNKSRGVRAKAEAARSNQEIITAIQPEVYAQTGDSTVIIPVSLSRKRFKKNWSRLIQKIYNVDPLKCPNCSGKMRIVAFIEEDTVVRKILKHLNKWLPQYHDPPDSKNSPENYNISASLNAYLQTITDNTITDNEFLENVQLNMFSDRCFEYQHPFEDEFSQEVFYED